MAEFVLQIICFAIAVIIIGGIIFPALTRK